MKQWKEYKLEQVCELIVDCVNRTAPTVDYKTPFLMIRTSDIKNGKIDFSALRNVTEETYNIWIRRAKPEIGDVILTREAPTGEVAMIKNHAKIFLGQRTMMYRADKSVLDSYFLYYSMLSPFINEQIKNCGMGSVVEHIRVADAKELLIKLPPLPEQRAIASVLSSLDDKIDLLHRQNATLEALAETLFRQWFVEEAEESWEKGKLGDFVEINPKRTLKSGTIAPYLEMSNVSNQVYHPDNWYNREFSSGTKFVNGDTLMARITPCLENGKSSYVDFLENGQVGWGSTEYIILRPKQPLHSFFSYVLTRNEDFRNYAISSLVGSSGRQRVDIESLTDYELAMPPSDVIEKFNTFCENSLQKMKNNHTEIRTLTQLRDTLLPKLMSGEVRVNI